MNYLEDLANMGYAEISSVPVKHGLYAAAFGLIAFLLALGAEVVIKEPE